MKKFIIFACLFVLTNCTRSLPTSFYNLSSDFQNEKVNIVKNIKVYVKINSMPKYLDRPQIVTKKSEVELEISEFNRWASPLIDNLEEVIKNDLVNTSNKIEIVNEISYNKKSDYTIIIDVKDFGGKINETAVINVKYKITNNLTDKTNFYEFNKQQPISTTYESLVTSLSDLTNKLAIKIAKEIKRN
ncbi:MAG: hypothetical protein BWY78_01004 [Alphaproteobacteria bacterium ADurb.Bin438]|nr:MAG: hypothetical protein BWY78_01004 [Alphaproteobacteria bacterium ADurb.Bin438]